MMEFTERTIGVWYVQLLTGECGQDWLASLWRDDDGIKGSFRFRYYRGDQSLQFEESQDVKHWYEIDLHSKTEADAIGVFRGMAEKLAEGSGGEKWELMMGTGGVKQFGEEFLKLPFASAKFEKVEP